MMGLRKLTHSKRFWTAVIGLVALVLNDLAISSDIQPDAIVTVIGVLIGGYSVQDTATALRKDSPQED